MEALARGDDAPFDLSERAALRLADAMAGDARSIPDAVIEDVRAAFGDAGLLEVVAVCGLFHSFNRINNALAVEVTR